MTDGIVIMPARDYVSTVLKPTYWASLNLMVPRPASTPPVFLPNATYFDGGQTPKNRYSGLRFSIGGMQADLWFRQHMIPRVVETESLGAAIATRASSVLAPLERLVHEALAKTSRNKDVSDKYLSGLAVCAGHAGWTIFGLDRYLAVARALPDAGIFGGLAGLKLRIVMEQGRCGVTDTRLSGTVEQMLVVLNHLDALNPHK